MVLGSGTRLGPFEISALIGAGGMGEVYRAVDTNLKRAVAIKVLPAAVSDDPDRLARFDREARVLASLNHPHIGAIYAVDQSSAVRALILELVEGVTLDQHLTRLGKGGGLPVAEALRIARQVADALEAAHEKGIIHRDLKPTNVKITPDGVVKVLDFGLARETGTHDRPEPDATSLALTQVGMIVGTVHYMSPEQTLGRGTDSRTDIWATGVVTLEMLTGHNPFSRETIPATVFSILNEPPEVPDAVRPPLR